MKPFLVLIAGLLFVAALNVHPALATSTFLIDFDANNTGYSVTFGALSSGRTGGGLLGTYYYDAPTHGYEYVHIARINIPVDSSWCSGAAVTITGVNFYYREVTSSANTSRVFYNFADGHTEQKVLNTIADNSWRSVSNVGSRQSVNSIDVDVAVATGDPAKEAALVSVMDDISITYECAIRAAFTASPLTGTAPLSVTFTDQSTGATSWHWDLGDGNSTTSQNITYSYSTPGAYTVTLTVTDGSSTDTASQVIYVNPPAGYATAASYKPLTSTDESPDWPMLDGPQMADLTGRGDDDPLRQNYRVHAFSNAAGADVHSVGDGEVTEVDTINFPQLACEAATGQTSLINGTCYTFVPTNAGPVEVYRIDIEHAYRVTVQHAEGQTITYVVDQPQVKKGDHVDAGCIIGKTLNLYSLVGLDLKSIYVNLSGGNLGVTGAFDVNSDPVGRGAVFLSPHLTDSENLDENGDPVPQRLRPLLVLEPDNLTPCNVDPAHKSCQKGANMYDPTDWDKSGTVIWNLGTPPSIYPGAVLMQQLPLQQDQAYSFVVNVRRLGTSGKVQLQLGNTTQSFDVSTQVSTFTLPAIVRPPDAGLLYTVSIVNTGTEPVQIIDGCVSIGTPSQNLGTCKFLNPSFDDGLSSWNHSNDIQVGNYIGEVFVHDDSTLSQIVALYPNGASSYEYQVTLRAAPGGVGWQDQTDSTVGFSWTYGALSGDFVSPSSSTSFALSAFNRNPPNYINFFPGGEVVFQANVLVSAPQSDPFIITVHYDPAEGWDGPILIRELCVTDAFGSDTGSGGGGLPWQPSCSIVSPPQDNNVSSWTYFLWTSLDRFFRCDLMTAINKGLDGLNQLAAFLRWQMLYWQSFAYMVVNWIGGQLVPWLGGHFRNIALGQVTTVNSTSNPGTSLWDVLYALLGGNGQSNLWDVLSGLINSVLGPFTATILSLITQAANLLFFVITSLLSIVLTIVTQLVSLIQQFFSFVGGLAGAWNNAPAIVPDGVPNCTVWTDNAFCILIWTLNNILAVGPGPILLALIVGMFSINTLLYVIAKIRDLILQVSWSA